MPDKFLPALPDAQKPEQLLGGGANWLVVAGSMRPFQSPDKSGHYKLYYNQSSDPALGTSEFWPGWPAPGEIDLSEREGFVEALTELPTARPEMYCELRAALAKALRGYGSLTRQQGTVRVRSGAAEEFRTSFKKDHDRALDRLLFKVSLGELGTREAVELLLPVLIDAPSRQLNAVFDAVMALNDPFSILQGALTEYDRTGRERFLSLAVSLLEQSGQAAWPVLRQLARSARPECELFIDTIANCQGVALADRLGALRDLLHHPDRDIRTRVSETLTEFEASASPGRLLALASAADQVK